MTGSFAPTTEKIPQRKRRSHLSAKTGANLKDSPAAGRISSPRISAAASAGRKPRFPRASQPSPAFDHWDEISSRTRAAKDIRLFLDFDGTLVDFTSRPDQVALEDEVRVALEKLARNPHIHIVMVSGRRRASLMQHMSVPHVEYFGLYGWEGEHGLPAWAQKAAAAMSRVRLKLTGLHGNTPGIFVEEKGVTVAIHFREASPAAQSYVRAELDKRLAPFRSDLHVIRGGHVWEIVPRQIRGKGAAIKNMLRKVKSPFLTFYLGDDLTDESAFSALRDGITVLVGPTRKTAARFILPDTDEVCVFLQRLEAEIP